MNKNKKSSSNILISTVQLKNPIIKDFFFAYNTDSTMICDFKISEKYFCYFLSLKYHDAFPTYIEARLNQLILKNQEQKFLFMIFDMSAGNPSTLSKDDILYRVLTNKICDENSQNIFQENSQNKNISDSKIEKLLTDLNLICLNSKTSLILCYSGYDLAQYLYSLSQMQNNDYGGDKMKHINLEEDLIETVACIQNINKTDANNLLSNFKDIKTICNASNQLLSLVPGMNQKKAKNIPEFFNFEFNKIK
jgi:hypothetical protein